MKKFCLISIALLSVGVAHGQQLLSLDSCRALAMRNNKQLLIAQDRLSAAQYEQQAAHTAYLPKVGLSGAYVWNQRSTHLLSKDTQNRLTHLGTNASTNLSQTAEALAQQSPQLAPLLASLSTPMVSTLNLAGQNIVNALQTSTYNVYAGALTLTQPIYLGGRIKAYDQITQFTTQLLGAQRQHLLSEVIYSTDQAYWQIVSLSGKKRLAESYVQMLQKLNDDISKMYSEGLTTKASTLTVNVKLNEAEMTLTKVNDGLSLARMLLCQLCGLPISDAIRLSDEASDELPVDITLSAADTAQAFALRQDLQMLSTSVKLAEQNVKLVRGSFRPSLMAMGGYSVMNPNVYNGFENKFKGNINVGIALQMPIWRWGESRYRIRAAQALAESQRHSYIEAKERIDLQVHQAQFKLNEAQNKLRMARKNMEKADENLHYADVGFHEGVIPASDMLEAQTAWLQARSERLDAEIEVKLAYLYLSKSTGRLRFE